MRTSPFLLLIVSTLAWFAAGCSDDAHAAAKDPHVKVDEQAALRKNIQDQEARIKELREQNEDLRRQLDATAPSGTSSAAKP